MSDVDELTKVLRGINDTMSSEGLSPDEFAERILASSWGQQVHRHADIMGRLGELLMCVPDEDVVLHVEKAQQDEAATVRMLAAAETDRDRLREALQTLAPMYDGRTSPGRIIRSALTGRDKEVE